MQAQASAQLPAQASARLLVTAGRAAAAVRAVLEGEPQLALALAGRVHFLPFLSQDAYDELLWGCDLNFVRGEDSLTRALWAPVPAVWQAYPQVDGAQAAKLEAWMQAMDLPDSLRHLQRHWNGGGEGGAGATVELGGAQWGAQDWDSLLKQPANGLAAWLAARQRQLAQDDLVTQMLARVRDWQ
jgi:uncharacterized repeat protein (TIGR03837 family)